MDNNTIIVCGSHPSYQVPLISTFAFPGAEQWCPYCGSSYDITGGDTEKLTPELITRHEKFAEYSKNYLTARSALRKFGKKPIPDDIREKYKKDLWAYNHNTQIEKLIEY